MIGCSRSSAAARRSSPAPPAVTSCSSGAAFIAESFASALSPSRYDPATQVVIAAPRKIGREWRLVIIGDRIIAASQYAEDGAKSVAAGCPDEVRDFVAGMLERRVVAPRPDLHDGRVRVRRAVVVGGA